MNRNELREQKEKEAKVSRQIDIDVMRADIAKKADICRRFTSDKRHAEFKALFDDLIFNQKFKQLLALPDTIKSTDEFAIKAIGLIKEMNTIKSIFYKPNVFIENDTKAEERK